MVALLDDLSPEAAALDAVNTVVFDGGHAIGHNTDASGFAESFRRGLPEWACVSLDTLLTRGEQLFAAYPTIRDLAVFDIEGAGTWRVAIADGTIEVTEGPGEADVTFSSSEESFEKIVAGEQNPTTAYMTGKLKIKGDMGAAMKLQKLF